jgi:hypothetical protein
MVSFTLRPLYSRGKVPRYPLDRRPVGPRTGVDDVERRKTLPHRTRNSDNSVIKLVVNRYTD